MNPKDIPKWDTSKMFYWEQKPEVLLFYEEEYRKIREGINLGGYYMSGWHYFHLNFFIASYMDKNTRKKTVGVLPFDDNAYFLMECYKKAIKEGNGFAMWGTRGFTKSTLLTSHEYWTHLTSNTTGDTSMIVYGSNSDLEAIQKNFILCNNKIHPAFKINVIAGNDWSEDVTFGTKLKNNTDLITSSIRLINAEGGSDKASEKTAGFTPIGFKMDEIGKYDPRKPLKAAKVSFKQQGISTFTFILSGTGGSSELSEGAKEVLTNPKDWDISIMNWDLLSEMVPEEHITWKEDIGRQFCTFVPGHMSYRDNVAKVESTFGELTKGKYDNDEINSLKMEVTPWKEANEFFYNQFNSLSSDDLKNSLRMYLPRNVDDTFLTSGKSSFNKERILTRLSEIKKNPQYSLVDLEIDSRNEKITRTFSDKKLADREYKGVATDSPYMIFEGFPEERPEDYAFVSGSDDYKSEASSTASLGTIYVLRRRKTSVEKKEKIVACLSDRPALHKTLHHKWEKLIRATNALCNLEINDAPFVSFLENDLKVIPYQYLHHFINPYQELVKHNKIGANPSGYKFGVYSNQWNKALMMDAVVDYVNSPEVIDYNEDGSPIFVDGYDYIEDPYLLEEMLDYTDKGGNYDRIMAFGWALVLARYMDSKNITPKESRNTKTSFEKDYRKTFTQPTRKFFGGKGKRSMF